MKNWNIFGYVAVYDSVRVTYMTLVGGIKGVQHLLQ